MNLHYTTTLPPKKLPSQLGVLLTIHNKKKQRGTKGKSSVGSISPSSCILCKRDEETVDHLLMHFQVARNLWLNVLEETDFLLVGLVVIKWPRLYGNAWF